MAKSKASATDTKVTTTPVETKAVAEATTEKKDSTKEAEKAETTTTAKKATAAKKTATKKTTTTAKKTTTKKAATKKDVKIDAKTVVQYSGKDVVVSDVIETVKKLWVEKFQGKLEEIKTVEIYVKPEENKAYFVVNGLGNGDFFVEL